LAQAVSPQGWVGVFPPLGPYPQGELVPRVGSSEVDAGFDRG
jgi:hypothetical protein